MTRCLTLCADDYAQSPAISEGIVRLVEAGRLSATSVMAQSPHWPDGARQLAPHAARIDVGLHINLTHPFDATARPLRHWLLMSHLGALSRTALRDAVLQQIDAFTEHMGRLPDFIDGHQHVHALPQVRRALTDAIALRWGGTSRPYLRAPDLLADGGDSPAKAAVVRWASRGFARHAKSCGLATPGWFGGLYSLQYRADFPGLMRKWLAASADRGLMMCHPGVEAADAGDPIGATRPLEYRYLAGEAFAELCREEDVVLARFDLFRKDGSI